jgi:putative transposase
MGKPLRFIPPGSVVEVTSRVIQSRLLLRPSPEVNDAILGVLGRALSMYKVELIAFAFLSNHFHLLVSPADGEQLARFMGHVKRNISDAIGRLHDWDGALWDRRYRAIVVADADAQVKRLRYILAQGCPEGLVASPLEWPGVHCARPLIEGGPMAGRWTDRSGLYEAKRRGEDFDPLDYEYMIPVRISPLPCWRGLTEFERLERCFEMVSEIEAETAKVNAKLGRKPKGAKWVLAQNPHDKPLTTKKSPAPLVHASTPRTRELFRALYRCFVDMYRKAAERLRAGEYGVDFPLHSFPPPRPFVRVVDST